MLPRIHLLMQQMCHQCRASFEISAADLAFYNKTSPIIGGRKTSIPPPTHCPDCRQQRRLAWRNERNLYHRQCGLTGKSIITNFGAHTGITVYDQHEWWKDTWDALAYGREFNFNKLFFDQFAELQREVPQLSLSVWNSENADYCNYIGHVKNSYLIFGSVYSEDCYYGSPYYSRDCVDTLVVRECEQCYECIDCRKLTHCFYCRDSWYSDNLLFCFDCQGCSECIGCAGLRKKSYCIFNEELTKQEYEERKADLNLCHPAVRRLLQRKLRELSLSIPHRYMQSTQVEEASGNYVYESKNVHDSFYADRSQDCRYCAQVVDLKDCYDNNYTEENELCCDYLGAYQVTRVSFSKFCNKVSDSFYCDACHQDSRHLFGCIGLKRKSYCILNKQYTREEYETLVPKIIEHMQRTGEWGEFFSATHSPFGYNETVAQEYFPLTKEQVLSESWPADRSAAVKGGEAHRRQGYGGQPSLREGWHWHDDEKREKYLGPKLEIPNDIHEVSDSICGQILLCESTGRPYKIIPQELRFYRKMQLPIPRKCPDQRHLERLAMRNPRQLWNRACAKCSEPIRTSYAPERPEQIFCEACYLKAVY